MATTEKTATIKATGEKVKVYRLRKGGWCNSFDMTTEYKDEELNFY